MNGPPASRATTSYHRADGPILAQRGGSAPPSPVPLADQHGDHRYLYTQPDYAVKTKDERLPQLETKHAGLTALRRIFIGPSLHQNQGAGGPLSVNSSGGGKGKARAAEAGDDSHRTNQRGISLPLRRRRRASTSATNETWGQTVGSSTEGDRARGGWHGASFEIGGDIRDAARRRDARLFRQREEAEQRVARDRQGEEDQRPHVPSQRLAPAPWIPRSPALTTKASFATAYTHLPPPTRPANALPPEAHGPPKRRSSLIHAFDHDPSRPPQILVTDETASDGVLEVSKHRPALPHLQSILLTHDVAPSTVSRLPAASTSAATIYNDALSLQPVLPGVRFPDSHGSNQPRVAGSGAAPPAPPAEVLARPDPDVESESLSSVARLKDSLHRPLHPHGDAAHVSRPRQHRKRPGDAVLRKERMLVRVDWTQREDLPDDFDENVARKYPTSKDVWEEVGVVWRASGKIELWGEYSLNVPATLSHRKKLKTVIPLTPKKTHLSLYSSTDLIFCLTHRPHSHHRSSASSRTVVRNGKPDERTIDGGETKEEPKSHKASKRGRLHFRTEGTNIFLFRARTHTTAKEWIWRLYRSLGGQLPRTIEVNVPALGAVVRLPVPRGLGEGSDEEEERETGEEEERAYRHLQPQAVIEACVDQLANVPDWHDLVEQAKRDGNDLRLAWRRDSVLDWVNKEPKGHKKRDWAVIGGIAFRQTHSEPVLELRSAAHYPTTCRIPAEPGSSEALHSTTVRISEPPGIEGFLIRRRPNGTPERVYLSSRMGMLFICRSSNAHPPEPPMNVYDTLNNPAAVVLAPFVFGMATLAAPNKRKREKLWARVSRGATVKGTTQKNQRRRDWTLKSMTAADAADEIFGTANLDCEGGRADAAQCDGNGMLEWLDRVERERAFLQITDARGFVDMSELESIDPEIEDPPHDQFVQVEDIGGQDGLNLADDKAKLRRMRSIVVRTRSGLTQRFECHSISVRDEWVGRLRALATYWRRRERVDAIQLMSLSPGAGLVNKLPPRSATHRNAWNEDFDDDGTPPPTRNEILSGNHLSHFYNWCVLDGCRAVMQKSVMHVKEGLRGMFHQRHVVLLPGILLEYQSITRDLLGRPLLTPYHRRRHISPLRDCYSYSGSLASHLLAPAKGATTWDPADESAHQLPRYYSSTDGLRTADDVEDCTFVIVQVKHSRSGRGDNLDKSGSVGRVYRTRSKLERDKFVYALNESIERIMRGEPEREARLREFPWLERI